MHFWALNRVFYWQVSRVTNRDVYSLFHPSHFLTRSPLASLFDHFSIARLRRFSCFLSLTGNCGYFHYRMLIRLFRYRFENLICLLEKCPNSDRFWRISRTLSRRRSAAMKVSWASVTEDQKSEIKDHPSIAGSPIPAYLKGTMLRNGPGNALFNLSITWWSLIKVIIHSCIPFKDLLVGSPQPIEESRKNIEKGKRWSMFFFRNLQVGRFRVQSLVRRRCVRAAIRVQRGKGDWFYNSKEDLPAHLVSHTLSQMRRAIERVESDNPLCSDG